MSSRTKPFAVRKGQYWASLNPNNRDGLMVLGLVTTTHGGTVTLKNVLEHPTQSEVTISKNVLLDKYKYVHRKSAELVQAQFRSLISTGIGPTTARIQQHETLRALRSITTDPPTPQMELPLEKKSSRVRSLAEVKQALTDKLKSEPGMLNLDDLKDKDFKPAMEIPVGTSERVRLVPFDEAHAKRKKQLEEGMNRQLVMAKDPGEPVILAAHREHLLKRKFELETELAAIKIALSAKWS